MIKNNGGKRVNRNEKEIRRRVVCVCVLLILFRRRQEWMVMLCMFSAVRVTSILFSRSKIFRAKVIVGIIEKERGDDWDVCLGNLSREETLSRRCLSCSTCFQALESSRSLFSWDEMIFVLSWCYILVFVSGSSPSQSFHIHPSLLFFPTGWKTDFSVWMQSHCMLCYCVVCCLLSCHVSVVFAFWFSQCFRTQFLLVLPA